MYLPTDYRPLKPYFSLTYSVHVVGVKWTNLFLVAKDSTYCRVVSVPIVQTDSCSVTNLYNAKFRALSIILSSLSRVVGSREGPSVGQLEMGMWREHPWRGSG